ncbi:MAG: HAMP domain-containing histidine kinase [Muribaculum sp.]|nr:HAMP domain-containing histidine kinase [Muribaculum sp.]
MKRFRSITIITLAAIAVMVVANIVYLHSLYNSIKTQSIQTATECLRRADILDIISRMKGTSLGEDDSFIRLTLMIQGEKTSDGSYEYPNLLEDIDKTMSEYFHFIASNSPDMKSRDLSSMEQIFRKELSNLGLAPKDVIVTDTLRESDDFEKYWEITINNAGGKPIVIGYISPMSGYIFNRMAGIIITSAVILILMSFLIWYLLHWVGKLRSIEQMKDDFTHNMTHELKTPVAVAYSAADSMLRYYDQSDEQRNKKFLTIIMQRLNLLSGMIENILSMSMERFKSMRLNIEKARLKSIVEEVVGMIEMKAYKPVKIEVNIADDVEISTDSLHFGNVISNLLDNAIKYSGNSVEIKICGNNHEISIFDNGIGIAKEYLPYIFDKFYRVTNGDRYEIGGYGLGLYYVKQIVDMQGWCISVISEENKGTTFTIKFSGDEKR